MKQKVFVPQVPSKFDAHSRTWLPSVDLEPARRYGELVVMLPPSASRLHAAPLAQAIKERMADYNERDILIALGDPSAIAIAAVCAVRATGGLLRMLKWDRNVKDYILVEIKI